ECRNFGRADTRDRGCCDRKKAGSAQRETRARRRREIQEVEFNDGRISKTANQEVRGRGSQLQTFQIFAELRAQIFALQGKLNRSFEETEFVAGIVAASLIHVRVYFLAVQQSAKSIGELQLARRPRLTIGKGFEDCRRQNVASNHG